MTRVRFEAQCADLAEALGTTARVGDYRVCDGPHLAGLCIVSTAIRIAGPGTGAGSRVTVLGDAYQDVHDPIDVKAAGRNISTPRRLQEVRSIRRSWFWLATMVPTTTYGSQ